ncbi:MAG: hypothetical protein K2X47_16260 [Bdellovibrionales bacterium]|nr:hypothetical protein [Bdellovibrionales bacterium]
MAMDWLPLFEYSAKYGISVSTLRRKIRQKSLVFRLDQGKYLVADQPVPTEQSSQRRDLNFVETPRKRDFSSPSLSKVESRRSDFSAATAQFIEAESKPSRAALPPAQAASTTLALVEEIKRAYARILQEKVEQICLLKEEISDLRTLVRVLETENSRKR